jgi:hypothetical protein
MANGYLLKRMANGQWQIEIKMRKTEWASNQKANATLIYLSLLFLSLLIKNALAFSLTNATFFLSLLSSLSVIYFAFAIGECGGFAFATGEAAEANGK